MSDTIKPGIYPDMSNEDYHAAPGISNSGISLILECPAKYHHDYVLGKREDKDTEDMKLGRLVHTLSLEPESYDDRYCYARTDILKKDIEIENKGQPKSVIDELWNEEKEARKLYLDENAHKEIIKPDTYETAKAMADSLRAHPLFKKMLEKKGHVEHSVVWQDDETGALLRTRPDYYNDFCIVDVKKTKNASPKQFAKSIYNYGYHRQAAMSCDGLSKATGTHYDNVVLFVVEDKAPYLCVAYLITEEAITLGREQYKKGAALYQECKQNNQWPGYPEKIVEIDIPHWAYNEVEQ